MFVTYLGYLINIPVDFYKGNLINKLPKYNRFIKSLTRKGNTFNPYKLQLVVLITQSPKLLWLIDHIMVHLIPAYSLS